MFTTNTHRRSVLALLAASSLLALTLPASAASSSINTLGSSTAPGAEVAINGYDTVAYFTQAKAVPGLDSFATRWMDATWRFSSQAHLDLFKANPEKYAPQYGGYCAYGVAKGSLVSVQPDQFSIVEDKLYLNFNASVHRQWKKDPAAFIKRADVGFPDLLKR